MENKEMTAEQALQIIFTATGDLQLKRNDAQVLDKAIQVLAQLLPKEGEKTND